MVFTPSKNLLKTRHGDQSGLLTAKPHITKPRLNYSFGLSQKSNLKPVSQESPPQDQGGNLHNRLLPSPKGK